MASWTAQIIRRGASRRLGILSSAEREREREDIGARWVLSDGWVDGWMDAGCEGGRKT